MASDVARFLRAVESTQDEALRWSKHTGDGPDCTWGVVALNSAGEHEWRSDGSRADQTWRGTKSEAHDYAKFLGTLHDGSGVSYSPRPFSSLTWLGDVGEFECAALVDAAGSAQLDLTTVVRDRPIYRVAEMLHALRESLEHVLDDLCVWFAGLY